MTPRIKFICLLTAFALSLFYTTSATEIRQDKVFSDITYEYELQEFASGKRYAYGTFTFNVLSNGYSEAIILSTRPSQNITENPNLFWSGRFGVEFTSENLTITRNAYTGTYFTLKYWDNEQVSYTNQIDTICTTDYLLPEDRRWIESEGTTASRINEVENPSYSLIDKVLHIHNPSNSLFNIILTDLTGRIHLSHSSDCVEMDLDLSHFPKGIYILHYKSTKHTILSKIII